MVFLGPSSGERQRDVFPLPYLPECGVLKRGLCRTVRRRVERRTAVNVTVNKAIHSLNLLFAGGEDFPRSTVENWVQLPLCQKDTLSHILAVVKDVGPPNWLQAAQKP